jgi:hypothetical protein
MAALAPKARRFRVLEAQEVSWLEPEASPPRYVTPIATRYLSKEEIHFFMEIGH